MDKICAVEWARQQPQVAAEEYHEINRRLLKHRGISDFDAATSTANETTIAVLKQHGFEPRFQFHVQTFATKTECERWYHPAFGVTAVVVIESGDVVLETQFDDGSIVFSTPRELPSNQHETSVYQTYERLQDGIDDHFGQVTLKAEHRKIVERSSLEQVEAHSEWYVVNRSSRSTADSAKRLEWAYEFFEVDPNDPYEWNSLFWLAALAILLILFYLFR